MPLLGGGGRVEEAAQEPRGIRGRQRARRRCELHQRRQLDVGEPIEQERKRLVGLAELFRIEPSEAELLLVGRARQREALLQRQSRFRFVAARDSGLGTQLQRFRLAGVAGERATRGGEGPRRIVQLA